MTTSPLKTLKIIRKPIQQPEQEEKAPPTKDRRKKVSPLFFFFSPPQAPPKKGKGYLLMRLPMNMLSPVEESALKSTSQKGK